MRVFDVKGFPIPRGKQAITIGAWIFTKTRGIIIMAHERVHVEQFRRNPFTFWFRYLFSKEQRFTYEAEAYAVSVNKGMSILDASHVLAHGYGLNKTTAEALTEINKYLGHRP